MEEMLPLVNHARLAQSGAAGMSGPSDTRDTMAPDRWQQIQSALADAIDCSASERRPAARTSGGR